MKILLLSHGSRVLFLDRLHFHCLDAFTFAEHPWIKDSDRQPQSPYGHGSVIINSGCQQNPGSCSFSALHVSASRDVSFGFASPIQPDPSSPTFTCQSSFSTFYNDATPSPPAVGFSFQDSCEPNAMEFSPAVSLMPSFSFFSPPPSDGQEITLAFRTDSSKANTNRRGKIILLYPAPKFASVPLGKIKA